MWRILFTKQAAKDAPKLKSAHLNDKAKYLLKILSEDPFVNPLSYEKLVVAFQGAYSRRINIQHRLVYQAIPEPIQERGVQFEGTIKVLSLWSHYER